MEKTNVLTLVITLVVGVILCGALLGPVINDVTETERTFDNSAYGFYQMKALEVGDLWERSENVWTYNEETIILSDDANVSILVLDNTAFRQNGDVRGTTQTSNNFVNAEVTEEGIVMFNEDKPISFNSGYGAVSEGGDYILKTYTDKAYVLEDTPLWITGVTGFAGAGSAANIICHIEGTIKDGLTITLGPVKNGTTSNLQAGEYTINYSEVPGYNGLYLIEGVSFTITADNTVDEVVTPISVDATYSTFVIPKEVTAERTVHLTDGQNSLIGVIPIMVIVALLMAAVGAIALRRGD